MQATLLTTASQELRIPLTVIKGCTATLLQHERRLPRTEQREFLWTICNATDQLEAALDYLAQLALLDEAEALAIRSAPIDLVRVVHDSIETINEKHSGQEKPWQANYRVRHIGGYHSRARRRYLVRADPYWLSTAIYFLLEHTALELEKVEDEDIDILFQPITGNQIQPISTAQGPHGTMVGTEALPSTPRVARQCVLTTIRCATSPSGSPTAPRSEHTVPAGARFARLDPARGRDEHKIGRHEVTELGLGYVLCQRIVQLHGGELHAEVWNRSEPNTRAGAIFHMLLPTEGKRQEKGRHNYACEEGDDSRGRR